MNLFTGILSKHVVTKLARLASAFMIALVGLTLPNAAHATETITYFHNDVAGTPLLSTNAAGAQLWKENYLPYGDRINKQAASASNSVWFAGKSVDAASGLSYFGARYYDPVLGRFMGLDPAGYSEKNGHSFNRYAYGNNNPYRFVDPDGRNGVTAFGGLIQESYNWMTGRGFDGKMVAGALVDGYNGQGAGFWASAGEDFLSFGGGEAAIGLFAKEAIAVWRGANAAKEGGIVANGIRGRASEARVLNELGLAKNTTAVSTAEGRSIPDALTRSLSVEVKDTANVSLTRQLRIQTEAARASGRESVLITGENTCVSGACSRAFDTIIRRPDLGPR